MALSTDRLYYISYLRIVSMIMVVYYHCICCYTTIWNVEGVNKIVAFDVLGRFLNNIHIPLFFAISGYLYGYYSKKGKYGDILSFIKNKATRLLLPFLPWSILTWLILSDKSYSFFIIYGASYLWFLVTLFVLFIIGALFNKMILNNGHLKDSFLRV